MAPATPLQRDIDTLQEMLGIPRTQAVILLEKYQDAEQAVNQYFEDSVNSVKPRAAPNQWEPADNIPYADDTTELPVMSRPPSRVDIRATDMTSSRMQKETGIPSPDDMQDADLQRAIAISQQDLAGQETGTVSSGQQFGPANRPYYDSNQWALTTISSSREIIDHPRPTKRQRLYGQPAFLRGSAETGYLAPLLNIYHSIPLAREAFLLPQMRILSYGYDPQWWAGTTDENAKSISRETSNQGSYDRQNFLTEIQCLMAFLDSTTRAYGSVDALADLRALSLHKSESQLSRLLETWVAAAMVESPDNQLTQIFTSTAIKASDSEGYPPIQKDLVCLEPTVRRIEGQTLVDLLDSTIWDDGVNRIDDIWIQQCAEIFTMRLYDPANEQVGLGIDIPLVWFPDRYMYDYRETTRQWRQEMLEIRQEINQCLLMQRRCEVAQGPGKRVIKIRDVLQAASKLSVSDSEATEALDHANQPRPSFASTGVQSESPEEMRSHLQAILRRLDEKVQTIERRKAELQKQIRAIGSRLTEPDPDPSLSPQRKYYLQGVSTKSNITYVRRRRRQPQALIDTAADADEPEFLWWRIVWGKDERVLVPTVRPTTPPQSSEHRSIEGLDVGEDSHSEQTYAVYAVDEAEVIQAAKVESNSIILVYASENAMRLRPVPGSAALAKFVEQDNRTFLEEVNREQTGGRRRHSQDTNATVMEDPPIDNRSVTPSNQHEMTPMSMTSPLRGADGQPSPKRPKGDESHVYRDLDSEDELPPYGDESPPPQMLEKKVNKIGLLADQMLERYSGNGAEESVKDEPVHIEHSKEPLR